MEITPPGNDNIRHRSFSYLRRVILFKKIIRCFYDGLINTVNHDGIEHSGYMAFLTILAFFPFLVFFVALAGFIGNLEIGSRFVSIVLHNLPASFITALEPRIMEIISGPPQGLMTVAIVGTIWTASSAVEGLRTALNRAYRVSTPPSYIWRRLLSIIQFVIVTLFVLVAMFFLIVVPLVLENLENKFVFLTLIDPVWTYARYIASISVLFFSVALCFYTLPNVSQRWFSVIPGAAIVVILWLSAGLLLATYLRTFHQVNLVYGSLGGIIAALLFFYISALILIYGAEVNYLIDRLLGYKFIPKDRRRKRPLHNNIIIKNK